MKRGELRIGDKVRFSAKVYRKPFAPYYDAYRGHTFEVVKFHYSNTHVELRCVGAAVKVAGYVHPDELVKIK